jgi:prolyl-tRNA synthetase
MHDGKALQSGTSHYFGDGFAKAFGIQFADKENKLAYPHQTSWGVTTRLIGAIIMTHGDDNGLVLPPAIAPVQVVIVPIASHKEGVVEKATEVLAEIKKVCRADIDLRDQTPGWKFAEHEMKGVPIRLEIGPKDIENGQCVLVRRDSREKIFVKLNDLEKEIPALLKEIADNMYNTAFERRDRMTYVAKTLDEMTEIAETKPGFIKAMWCGDRECEDKLKEVAGVTSRCMPFEQEELSDRCVCCGKPAKKMVYWGKAY